MAPLDTDGVIITLFVHVRPIAQVSTAVAEASENVALEVVPDCVACSITFGHLAERLIARPGVGGLGRGQFIFFLINWERSRADVFHP